MLPDMLDHICPLDTPEAAKVAGKWLFSSVCESVILQRPYAPELLFADVTLEWPLVSVGPLVRSKLVLVIATVLAKLALDVLRLVVYVPFVDS